MLSLFPQERQSVIISYIMPHKRKSLVSNIRLKILFLKYYSVLRSGVTWVKSEDEALLTPDRTRTRTPFYYLVLLSY